MSDVNFVILSSQCLVFCFMAGQKGISLFGSGQVVWCCEEQNSHLCLSGLGSAEECNKRLLHKDQPMTYPRMVTECTLVRAFVISQDQCWLLAHFYNYFVHTCNIEREVFVKYSFCFIQIRN